MGGLLAADTLLAIANSRPDGEAPLWPRIIACIAFDTPVSRPEMISIHMLSGFVRIYFVMTVLRASPIRVQE